MTEMKDEEKKRNRYPDRFTVDPQNLEKLGGLIEQLRTNVQGCDATRKELLNWIIEKFPETLSAEHLQELTNRFYDEERFLRLALEEVRSAKSRGERKTLEEILQRKPTATPAAPKRRRKKLETPGDETVIETQAEPETEMKS